MSDARPLSRSVLRLVSDEPVPSEAAKDALIVVAFRTDQPSFQRRIVTILAAGEPVGHVPLPAEVIAREEPTANDADRLEEVFGYDVLARLGWHRVG